MILMITLDGKCSLMQARHIYRTLMKSKDDYEKACYKFIRAVSTGFNSSYVDIAVDESRISLYDRENFIKNFKETYTKLYY